MNLKPDTYVPSLRWRQGEYQALSRLSDDAKGRVVPFIVVPEIEFDFEEWRPKKTVQEHVATFPTRFRKKWKDRPAWIGVHTKIETDRMDDGRLPIEFVFDELRGLGSNAVPVVAVDPPLPVRQAVRAAVMKDGRGVCVRLRLENLMSSGVAISLTGLIGQLELHSGDVDIVVDLGAPNYEPYEDFADALVAALRPLGDLFRYRSFVVLGSAFPQAVALEKPGGTLPRRDWEFFKILQCRIGEADRRPNYGDYTVVNPEFTPRDMRKIKSGGKVVYTSKADWIVRKGGAFRDNPKQMHDHCAFIVTSGCFRGGGFSDGDDYIEKCAKRIKGPSNQPRWKQVAINHHIMHVLEDLASVTSVP